MNRSFLGRQNGLGPCAHRIDRIIGQMETGHGIIERYGEVTDEHNDEFYALCQNIAFRLLYGCLRLLIGCLYLLVGCLFGRLYLLVGLFKTLVDLVPVHGRHRHPIKLLFRSIVELDVIVFHQPLLPLVQGA